MIYYKSIEDGIVIGIGTLNADGMGNISGEEYETIMGMIIEKPSDKCIRDNGDGTYEYEDAPPIPEPELEDSEALSILLGGEGS